MSQANAIPFPDVCDDPVTNWMVMEAVTLKVQEEDREAEKAAEEAAEKKEWKQKEKERLKNMVNN